VSDPYRFTTIAHAGRALLGPLSCESVDGLLADITIQKRPLSRPRVVDIGCGKGEILLRAMKRFGAQGTGIEPNPAFAAEVLGRASERGVTPDLVLHELPVGEAPLLGASFDLAICTGSGHAFGDTPDALAALAKLVPRGGWALFGVGYWKRPPAKEYLDAFGGSEDELRPLEVTVALPAGSGWTVMSQHESTPVEWDEYEFTYARNMRHWLEAHADDPDASAFRSRIESWNGAYVRWGRETMGFVTLVLRR
jgi:SAM-dependent methyltransferase